MRYKHDNEWKEAVAAVVGHLKPDEPVSQYGLALTRFSSAEPDFDGLVSGFKVIIDALRELGFLADDKLSNTGAWHCQWVKCKPKRGFIRIEIASVDQYALLGL